MKMWFPSSKYITWNHLMMSSIMILLHVNIIKICCYAALLMMQWCILCSEATIFTASLLSHIILQQERTNHNTNTNFKMICWLKVHYGLVIKLSWLISFSHWRGILLRYYHISINITIYEAIMFTFRWRIKIENICVR